MPPELPDFRKGKLWRQLSPRAMRNMVGEVAKVDELARKVATLLAGNGLGRPKLAHKRAAVQEARGFAFRVREVRYAHKQPREGLLRYDGATFTAYPMPGDDKTTFEDAALNGEALTDETTLFRVDRLDDQWFLSSQGEGGGVDIRRFKIIQHFADFLQCSDANPAADSTDTFDIAKPWELRSNPWNRIEDSLSDLWQSNDVKYNQLTPYNRIAFVGPNRLDPESWTHQEDQYIIRPYLSGDLIDAANVGSTVTGITSIKWLDLNTGARRWMENPLE